MHTFKDNQGRDWDVQINVDTIKRVRGLLDVDLLDAVGGDILERLVGDPVMLCDVLYAVCKPEAEEHGVSDEEFGRGMAGQAIDSATEALLEELTDFFPSRTRRLLKQALKKMNELQDVLLKEAQNKLESGDLDKTLLEELRGFGQLPERPAGLSGTSPASSESTPAP